MIIGRPYQCCSSQFIRVLRKDPPVPVLLVKTHKGKGRVTEDETTSVEANGLGEVHELVKVGLGGGVSGAGPNGINNRPNLGVELLLRREIVAVCVESIGRQTKDCVEFIP
jgi:hypothetical protein